VNQSSLELGFQVTPNISLTPLPTPEKLGQRALEEDVVDMLYVATQSTFSIGRTQSNQNLVI
jgi:hypothetical protein